MVLNTTIENQYPDQDTSMTSYCAFKSMTAKSGVTAPGLLKLLSLYPVDTTNPVGNIWVRNSAERLALRGGSYTLSSGAGQFSIHLFYSRSYQGRFVGFRPAFIL